MARISLLVNTLKYLKLTQLVNQIAFRIRPKEMFWKYTRKNVKYQEFDLWIDGLDNTSKFMNRFCPEKLCDDQLTLLYKTKNFTSWYYDDESHLWNFNVHYMEYLVPLYGLWKKTGDKKYRDKINEILKKWYEEGSYFSDSNQPYTISLRIVNQLIIAEAVDDKQKFFDSIYAQYRFLIRNQEIRLLGNHYLENLKSIVICSVVFKEENVYERYIRKLVSELKEEILECGFHFELSFMYHKIVLEDLIRVGIVLREAEKKEYQYVFEYITKMYQALFSLERGIDRTPLFNDAGDNVAKPTESLLEVCEDRFNVLKKNCNCTSGYYKLHDSHVTVLIDCGELGPTYMPGHAHCDCLSFELFYNGKPVFVNAGTYQYQGDKRPFFRSTAAHNTVTINNHEQSELWGEHRAGRRIRNIQSRADENAIIGSYTNYLGEKHVRKISLQNGELEVTDKTSGSGRSYLHIAPGMKYENGIIHGEELSLMVEPINADLEIQNSPYAENFGKLDEIECLVFSWDDDAHKHGYLIKIGEVSYD